MRSFCIKKVQIKKKMKEELDTKVFQVSR